MKLGVLGSGNGGTALAFEASSKGYEVIMSDLPDFLGNIKAINRQGGVFNKGETKQFAKVEAVEEIEEVFKEAQLIFITVPSYGIKPFAQECKKHVKKGHTIVLCPGAVGGALEFKKALGIDILDEEIVVAETSTLPYACRLVEPGCVAIYLFVKKFILAALPSNKTEEVFKIAKRIWPAVEKGENVVHTSLSCGNPVIHPAITLLNTGLVERTGGDFRFYADGVTDSVGNLIKAVDEERLTLGRALDVDLIREPEMGVAQGYMTAANYWDGYSKSEAFKNIMAPPSLDYRFITEDVAYGLTFWSSLGDLLDVKTPVIDAVITIASAVTDGKFRKHGTRKVEDFGLDERTLKML